jgi:hypothetical protein
MRRPLFFCWLLWGVVKIGFARRRMIDVVGTARESRQDVIAIASHGV